MTAVLMKIEVLWDVNVMCVTASCCIVMSQKTRNFNCTCFTMGYVFVNGNRMNVEIIDGM